MERFYLSLLLLFVFVVLFLIFHKHRSQNNNNGFRLPPGALGFPIIGESLEFLSTGRKGYPQKFIFDRVAKYSSEIFKTNIFGERTVVLAGASGNKFLFSNENKHVFVWWPDSVNKLFPSTRKSTSRIEGERLRKFLPLFMKPEALQRYVSVMDVIAQKHFATYWEQKEEVVVFPLAKTYTFFLACKIFLSIEDTNHIAKFYEPFDQLASAIISVPIDLPGTPFNRGIKASKFIKQEILAIIKQRKLDLSQGKADSSQDILSLMLTTCDDDGQFVGDMEIADKIIGLLIAGHDTASTVCASIVKYLSELAHIYDGVYTEQMDIVKNKDPGVPLKWEDIQRMKYSWKVVSEVMRLTPPIQGTFREAMNDFVFNGFSIPKGWKLYWSTSSTHRNAQYFPEPENFDPSRYDGSGPAPYTYVPFGGGPRMCPGKEYARIEILVFLHHLVRRFKFEKIIPDEKIVVDPLPVPEKGLPVRLYPHQL